MEPNQNMSMPGVSPERKSYGPLIAVVIILALVIIGGLYFLGQRMQSDPYKVLQENTKTPQEDSVTASLQAQSNSDDVSSIEADIKATNVDGLDQGASVIESEL